MATTAIPRMKFKDVDESLNRERIELAKKAQATLGYGKLAQAIAVPGALLYTLRKLHIAPLQTDRVERYMRKKTKVGMYSGTKQGVAGIVGIGLGALSITVVVGSMPSAPYPQEALIPTWMIALLTLCIFLTAVSFVTLLHSGINEKWGRGRRRKTSWESISLSDYQGNVPEFALSKALEIKAEMPDVNFGVYRLIESVEEKKRPLPDPFLAAFTSHKDGKAKELYYIDVWDEKEYNAEI